ncbi:MAG TPA: hypothetical protein VK138_02240 [Acidiferrobacterales bacterium]|nr:hypothetical protein [Acidiferrobacterales bacterium]
MIDITKHPREILKYVRFGPNEVELLEEDGLAHRIPIAALRRFDRRYWFPLERRLAGFYWLIGTAPEAPGPIWERTWSAILDTLVSEIGRLALYEPAYPAPVEDALFVLLLRLVKTPSGEPWKPFAIPWIYSITDDPFAEPPRAPDPSSLTWTLVGDEHHEFEVPDRSEEFKVVPEELTGVLEQRWRQLRTISERQYKRPNFNLLTKHFFVKAFAEESIDELLANLSCIEATLMLPKEKNRKMMMKRYKSLVVDDDAYATLDHAYCLRNKYLHSTGNPADAISWKDLAMARWSVTKAVDRYLSLTETRGDLNRQELLCLLERQDPSNR